MSYKKFVDACVAGDLKVLSLMDLSRVRIHKHNNKIFHRICVIGNLDVLKFLLSLEPQHGIFHFQTDHLEQIFVDICEAGPIYMLDYLLDFSKRKERANKKRQRYPSQGLDIHYDNDKAFRVACANGRLDVVQYLIGLELIYGQINIHADKESAFLSAVHKNYTDVAEYLMSLKATHGLIVFEKFKSRNYKTSFYNACNGLVENAKLLLQCKPKNDNIYTSRGHELVIACAFDNIIFMRFVMYKLPGQWDTEYILKALFMACHSGYIESLDKLIEFLGFLKQPIDIHYDYEAILVAACASNSIPVIKRLLSLESKYGKFNFHASGRLLEYTFINRFTRHSHYKKSAQNVSNLHETVRFLFSLEKAYGKFDIHYNNEFIFRELCKHLQVATLKFLFELQPERGKIDIHAGKDVAFRKPGSGDVFLALRHMLIKQEPQYAWEVVAPEAYNSYINDKQNFIDRITHLHKFFIELPSAIIDLNIISIVISFVIG